jgi:uncharacterized protein YbaP (TraB family)
MNLKHLLTNGAAALSLALASPAAAQEATSADGAMPAGASPGPALWQLADEDTTIYLFGTVHVLPAETQWMDSRIDTALTASDELVFEIDLNADSAAMQQVISGMGALEGEQTLRELMKPDDRAEFEAALGTYQIAGESFDRVEPWLAAMTLSMLPLQMAGYSAQSGVERALNARAEDKKKAALETIEEQIRLFDSMPLHAQLAFLDETVEAIPEVAGTVEEMVAMWLAGDAVSLAALLNEEVDDPDLYRRLLSDRNANWVEWIDTRMDSPGNVFIAVGAGHLAGKDSVQELLAARGFSVTRIWQ